jgi:hydroxymethylbilane synthase
MRTFRLLSRGSDLAVLQAHLAKRALRERWPHLDVQTLTRSSSGDRDSRVALWTAAEKGLFTADLSEAVVRGEADAAIHSWKDLPVEPHAGTVVAGTLPRADPRDTLLVRRDVLSARPTTLAVLTSSPRRAWQLHESAARLLPWAVSHIDARLVRGNIPTRLRKLVDGEGHALVVAKAALDRLLSSDAPSQVRLVVADCLARCAWMVLPIREFPTAPAQGALALEVATANLEALEIVRAISDEPTRRTVERERSILAAHGGGCHEAIGATVLAREYGDVRSVRGGTRHGQPLADWTLEGTAAITPPRLPPERIWPRPDERTAIRRRLDVRIPAEPRGLWISRAEALPDEVDPGENRIVWVAGMRTWERLAARGIWVHGCADGLGDDEPPRIETLSGGPVQWLRLTHADAAEDDTALATYQVERTLPGDLAGRQAFFWTSGTLFREALQRFPEIARGWHASGPGRTARVVRHALPDATRASIWLDYETWLQHVTR